MNKYIAEVLEYLDKINGVTYSAGRVYDLTGELVLSIPYHNGDGVQCVFEMRSELAERGCVSERQALVTADCFVHVSINQALKARVVELGKGE